jgi:hypothetical protein
MSGYPVNLTTLITGENQSLGAMEVIDGVGEYEYVTASSASIVLGSTGAAGDYLGRMICVVVSSASSLAQIHDGTTTMTIMQANTTPGTYVVPLGIKSTSGGWKLSTLGSTHVIAVGAFT